MFGLLMDTVADTGLLDHTPHFETEGEIIAHLIGLLYIAGETQMGDDFRQVFSHLL